MKKLLLVDDEPLVLVGLQGMLPWEDFGIQICATARNGAQAMELIEQKKPDIVIADIMMPVQSGLDLLHLCRKKYGRLPLFIILTSVEEYNFARQAVSGQAIEYLVKLELTPETLGQAIAKAVETLNSIDIHRPTKRMSASERLQIDSFYDRFFVRLFNNLFESKEQFLTQQAELGIDFSFSSYVICHCKIDAPSKSDLSADHLAQLYTSTARMAWETITRYMACYITNLELSYFAITFCLSEQESPDYQNVIKNVLKQTITILKNYFNVNLICGVGNKVYQPLLICDSFKTSHLALLSCENKNICFYNNSSSENLLEYGFLEYKKDLPKAIKQESYEEVDSILEKILSTLKNHPGNQSLVMETACNLLFFATSHLSKGEHILEQIFSNESDNYKTLYILRTPKEVLRWIELFKTGIVTELQSRRKAIKNKTIDDIKAYISANIEKRITLNQTAATFCFNPNYLSQFFTKHVGCSFIDYVNAQKIEQAKLLIADGDMKIYEIAEQLGFESAFYFSKVFKKYTTLSPREYAKNKLFTN